MSGEYDIHRLVYATNERHSGCLEHPKIPVALGWSSNTSPANLLIVRIDR